MGIRGRLSQFIEDIIPPEDRSTNPLIYRTSFLRITLLVALCFIGSAVAFAYSLGDLLEGDTFVGILDLVVGFLLLSAPFVAKKYRNIDRIATVVLIFFGSIFLVAVFEELPEDKSSLIWLGVIPAVTFFIKGKKGLLWSVGCLWIHFFTVLVAGKVGTDSLTDAYLSYALVTIVFYFYAWTSERYQGVWENLARVDSLTGALNRTAFEEILNREIKKAERYGGDLSLILFDIDNFKQINDTYGHLFGDQVLKRVASIVSENIRETDIFARWGGEEFMILLPNTGISKAVAVAEKLRRMIEAYRFGEDLTVTVSFGVVSFTNGDDSVRLILKADKALYRAKEKGKNRVESFTSEFFI